MNARYTAAGTGALLAAVTDVGFPLLPTGTG